MGYLLFIAVILILLYWAYTLFRQTRSFFKTAKKSGKKDMSNTLEPRKESIIGIIAHPDSRRYGGLLSTKKVALDNYKILLSKIIGQGDNTRAVELIESVKWPRGESRHYDYLNNLSELINKEISPHFLFSIDWRASVADLHWHIEQAVKGLERPKPVLPNPDKYPSDASVQYGFKGLSQGIFPESRTSPVFEDYIRALNEVGLGLGFMETLADNFLLFIFDIDDRKELRSAIAQTGAGPGKGYIT